MPRYKPRNLKLILIALDHRLLIQTHKTYKSVDISFICMDKHHINERTFYGATNEKDKENVKYRLYEKMEHLIYTHIFV